MPGFAGHDGSGYIDARPIQAESAATERTHDRMKILVTGICGFVGRVVAEALAEAGHAVRGIDNFSRPGSRTNLKPLQRMGIQVAEGDLRDPDSLAKAAGRPDWIVDAAADPRATAGMTAQSSSRTLVDNNLLATVNVLELCKKANAGLILLSTSRVYSIGALGALRLKTVGGAFKPAAPRSWPAGLTERGIGEGFSTAAPVSLYGACKLASEVMALEYGSAFGFPVWINRCGVMAGAGQFGTPDQGIFSYWINAWLRDRPLRYIGFGGKGHQVRDCFHPRDLGPVLLEQMSEPERAAPRIVNISGGTANAMSLRQLSDWCAKRFGPRQVQADTAPRIFDIPWMVLDSTLAKRSWSWVPLTPLDGILEEIAAGAEARPDWLAVSGL
jgi:CDP-paratose 2-epimerase